MRNYDIGDQVRLTVRFADEAGEAVDPTVVVCKTASPLGLVSTYTYGVDEGVGREDEGSYFVDLIVTVPGAWSYRWESSGAVTAAGEGQFNVRRSAF